MKTKKTLIYVALAIVAVVITICVVMITKRNNSNTTTNQTNIEVSVNYKEEDTDTNWKEENYEEINLSKSINITKAGTYHLTGTLEDGSITVNVGDDDLVKLVLDTVNITCSNSSAINVENARKVIITVEEEAGSTIKIKNSNGEEIITFTATKTYNSLVVSSEKFEKGETYTIYSNDEKVEEITIESIVTSAGNKAGGLLNMQMPQGGMQKAPNQGGGKQGAGKMNF